jgi:hypothetical protein
VPVSVTTHTACHTPSVLISRLLASLGTVQGSCVTWHALFLGTAGYSAVLEAAETSWSPVAAWVKRVLVIPAIAGASHHCSQSMDANNAVEAAPPQQHQLQQQQQLQLVARPIPPSEPEKTQQEAIPRSAWQPLLYFKLNLQPYNLCEAS